MSDMPLPPTMAPKNDATTVLFFVIGLVLALVIWGLQLIGITVSVRLGGLVLLIAFVLMVYAFWIWEGASRWRRFMRLGTIGVAAIVYFGLVGQQIRHEWKKDHPAKVERANPEPAPVPVESVEAPSQASAPYRAETNQQRQPESTAPTVATGKPNGKDRRPGPSSTFSESLGDFVVIVGGHPRTVSGTSTRQHPANIAPFGDATAIRAYVERGKIFVDASVVYALDRPPLRLVHNNLQDQPPEWDRNWDSSAIEIVDDKLIPRFQLIYKNARTAILRGVFRFSGGAMVLGETNSHAFIGGQEDSVNIVRLFKYPSRLYQGLEVSLNSHQQEPPPPSAHSSVSAR